MTVTAVKVHDIIHDPPLIDVAGATVLVDRLWPRGVAKTQFTPDYWLKDVAPSTELRKWFGHEPARFTEFRERYLAELDAAYSAGSQELHELMSLVESGDVALVYAAHSRTCNHAIVLEEWLSAPKDESE